VEVLTKLLPFTIKLKSAPPAVAEFGIKLVIAGAGLLIVKIAAGDDPLLHFVVEAQVFVVELVGVEVLLGVEDLADADVAVHRLADDRERLRLNVIDADRRGSPGPGGQPRVQLDGAGAELFVRHRPDLRLQLVHLVYDPAIALEQPVVTTSKNLREE